MEEVTVLNVCILCFCSPHPLLPDTPLSRISGVDFALCQRICSFPALAGPLLWASPFLGLRLPSLPKGALRSALCVSLLFVGFLESHNDSEAQELAMARCWM